MIGILSYSQWVSTDMTNLITTLNTDEFIDLLTEKVQNLTRHNFIAKAQSNYLKKLKNILSQNELIILRDFSENYSFIAQDSLSGQVTIHSIVVYNRQDQDGTLQYYKFCFISHHLI